MMIVENIPWNISVLKFDEKKKKTSSCLYCSVSDLFNKTKTFCLNVQSYFHYFLVAQVADPSQTSTSMSVYLYEQLLFCHPKPIL